MKRRGRIPPKAAETLVAVAIAVGMLTVIVVAVELLTWRKTIPAEALRPVSKGDLVALGVGGLLAIAALIFVKRG